MGTYALTTSNYATSFSEITDLRTAITNTYNGDWYVNEHRVYLWHPTNRSTYTHQPVYNPILKEMVGFNFTGGAGNIEIVEYDEEEKTNEYIKSIASTGIIYTGSHQRVYAINNKLYQTGTTGAISVNADDYSIDNSQKYHSNSMVQIPDTNKLLMVENLTGLITIADMNNIVTYNKPLFPFPFNNDFKWGSVTTVLDSSTASLPAGMNFALFRLLDYSPIADVYIGYDGAGKIFKLDPNVLDGSGNWTITELVTDLTTTQFQPSWIYLDQVDFRYLFYINTSNEIVKYDLSTETVVATYTDKTVVGLLYAGEVVIAFTSDHIIALSNDLANDLTAYQEVIYPHSDFFTEGLGTDIDAFRADSYTSNYYRDEDNIVHLFFNSSLNSFVEMLIYPVVSSPVDPVIASAECNTDEITATLLLKFGEMSCKIMNNRKIGKRNSCKETELKIMELYHWLIQRNLTCAEIESIKCAMTKLGLCI